MRNVCTVRNVCNIKLGPTSISSLLPGEKVAVCHRRVLGRKGCSVVRVRIVGSGSLGWLESAIRWGAGVDHFLTREGNITTICKLRHPDVIATSPSSGYKLPPHHIPWDGMVCLL